MRKILSSLFLAMLLLLMAAPTTAQSERFVVPKKIEASQSSKFGPVIGKDRVAGRVIVSHRFNSNITIFEMKTGSEDAVEAVGIKPVKSALSPDSAVKLVFLLFGDPGELIAGDDSLYNVSDPKDPKKVITYKNIYMRYMPYNMIYTMNMRTGQIEFITVTFNWV